MNIKYVFLIALFTIGIFLRLFMLDKVPPHPSLDEASIGYNAFSLLETGKDEFGNKYPVLLRAYDDYRPAHYTYLVLPFVKLFGLQVVSVRLPSIILSVLTLISVYILVRELFSKYDKKDLLSVFSVLILTVSPWHIYISRLGHEVNLFFSAFIFGITFFYLFLNKQKKYFLYLSSIFFAISFSAYQSGKIFIPLMLIILFLVYFKELIKKRAHLAFCSLLFLAIITPILVTGSKPEALVRFEATNIFTSAEPYLKESAQKILEAKENNDLIGQIINNRRFVYIRLPLEAYITHLNPFWLFTNSGIEGFKAPNLGLLYIFELPLIIIGTLFIFSKKILDRKKTVVLAFWLIISILPGAITTGYPHAMRIYQVLPIPQIIGAYGFIGILHLLKFKRLTYLLFIAIVIVGIGKFIVSYFIAFPKITAPQFQFGIYDAVKYTSSVEKNFEQIQFSNKDKLFQSYMFYLFFTKYDPNYYLMKGGSVSGGFAEEHQIGKYKFGSLNKLDTKKRLIVSNPQELMGYKKIKTIYNPDGSEALWILTQ